MSMAYTLVNVLLSLAVAVLLVVGVILMARGRREHGTAAVLGLWGCVVLLIGLILGVVRSFTLPMVADAVGSQSLTVVLLAENALQTLLTVVGTGLLIWAVIARRPPSRAPGSGPAPDPRQPAWQPPQAPPPPYPYPQPPQQPGRQHPPQPS
ncbi:hypothetical protein ACGF0J_26910 [Nonomuraea sp. NPDC047897]|uniref:hypothetical protein n=1 Tax=Nonomuraea sp. NPDC047897 TaxID=3364346 RepID=UPI003721EA81